MEEIVAFLASLDAQCKENPDKARTLAFKCLDVGSKAPAPYKDAYQVLSTLLFNLSTQYVAQGKNKAT